MFIDLSLNELKARVLRSIAYCSYVAIPTYCISYIKGIIEANDLLHLVFKSDVIKYDRNFILSKMYAKGFTFDISDINLIVDDINELSYEWIANGMHQIFGWDYDTVKNYIKMLKE